MHLSLHVKTQGIIWENSGASSRKAATTICRMNSQTPKREAARTTFVGGYNEVFEAEDYECEREVEKDERDCRNGGLLRILVS